MRSTCYFDSFSVHIRSVRPYTTVGFLWCFCSLILAKWQWPWGNFCQQYFSTSFFCKFILFISRFKKEKKDILIFITIKKNNIMIIRRFTTCFKFFIVPRHETTKLTVRTRTGRPVKSRERPWPGHNPTVYSVIYSLLIGF